MVVAQPEKPEVPEPGERGRDCAVEVVAVETQRGQVRCETVADVGRELSAKVVLGQVEVVQGTAVVERGRERVSDSVVGDVEGLDAGEAAYSVWEQA